MGGSLLLRVRTCHAPKVLFLWTVIGANHQLLYAGKFAVLCRDIVELHFSARTGKRWSTSALLFSQYGPNSLMDTEVCSFAWSFIWADSCLKRVHKNRQKGSVIILAGLHRHVMNATNKMAEARSVARAAPTAKF